MYVFRILIFLGVIIGYAIPAFGDEQARLVFQHNQLEVIRTSDRFTLDCEIKEEVINAATFICGNEDEAVAEVTIRFDEKRGTAWLKKENWFAGKRQWFKCEVNRLRPLRADCVKSRPSL